MGDTVRPIAELNDRPTGVPFDRGDWWRLAGIGALGLVLTVTQAVLRPGYVLDDWYAARNVEFGGAFEAADHGLRVSRPGAALTFGLAFGYAGDSRLAMVLVRMVLVVGAAVLSYLILRRFFGREVPVLTVLLWLLLPNHMSLELWPSALVSVASLVALLGGCLLLCRARVAWWALVLACVLVAFAVLTYESSAAPAAVAAVVLPWVVARRIQWRPILAVGATLGLTTLWSLTHWHNVKSVHNDSARYPDVLQAHFGWGVFPDGPVARIALLAALVGITVVVARVLLPSLRPGVGPPEWLVLSGVAVMVVGSATFALYYYAPLGAGDRVNYISSLGGAMVVVGLLWMVWLRIRVVAVGLAALVLVGAMVARVERTDTWVTASDDADRIVEAIRGTDPSCEVVYLGPEPIQRQNVAAFLDRSNVDGAVQIALGRQDVAGAITFDEATFDSLPEGCRVDIRPLSELEPDTTVVPG